MTRFINILLVLLTFSGTHVLAEEVDFKVSAPSRVSMGERFRLSYQINADVDDFSPPALSDFRVLSGPSRGQNSSIQIINGKVTQNINISYTYILTPNKEGELTIGSASAKINGKTYKTEARKIIVNAGTQSNNQTHNTSHSEQQGELQANDVYIKAFLNKKEAYLGEQIIVNYRIYTKVPVSNLSIDQFSSFSGFWSVDLMDNNGSLKQRSEIINGEEYIVADLKKAALFPQKTGKLEIDPMSLSCVAQVQTNKKKVSSNDPFFDSFFNDPFFSNQFRNIEKTLVSNKLDINIRELPSSGKTNIFSGAVGQFSLGSNIDNKEIKAHEAINIKYTISGNGNVDLLPDLVINFPADFEVYDPKISTKTRKNKDGISGYKTFEYTIIPRSSGIYEIPSVNFTYFDPIKKQYKTLSSDSYEIIVDKSTQSNNQNISYGAGNKEDIRYIGKDIRYIFLMPFSLEPFEHFFFGSNLFFILLISPIIIMFLIVFIWRKEKKRRGNTNLMKNKNATKVAKKRLKKAYDFLKAHQEADFYNETGEALWGYVSDKFNIPLSELSVNTVTDKLSSKGVIIEVVNEFIDTLNNCEFARFAPGDKDSMMEKVYQQGITVISKIEDQLK